MKKLLIVLSLCPMIEAFSQTLHYDRPADYFEEALVIGNGTMGGIVYGGASCDRISLNDITLWTGEPCNMNVYSPDAHQTIPSIREALKHGNYREADKLQREVQGHFSQNYQPLGQLSITYLDTTETVTNYRRWLDLSNATASTLYYRGKYLYSTEYFASNPDSGIVVHITTDNPRGIHARFSLSCQLRHQRSTQHGNTLVTDGYAGYASLPSYYDAKEKFAYDPNRGIHFRTKVLVSAENVKVAGDDVVVDGAGEVTLYIVNATSFNGYDKDPVKQGKPYKQLADAKLKHISDVSYPKLWNRHVKDYQSIYNRVKLSLGSRSKDQRTTDVQLREYIDENRFNPELEALYFQYGRYLLISCSRTPNVPANLQGLWNESILPPWSCNYTSNINVEENYWAAETAALPEMHQSLFSYMKELQGSGELTAKAYYGVQKGWCLAHNTDIWAMTCPVGLHTGDPMWANWNMGGAWLSTHIWEHYTFSLDRDFLREYYPVLKGAAEFCLGWMVSTKDMGVDGQEYLITAPATSPENSFVTPDGYHGRTCYGGFADIAMIRECLSDARDAAIVLRLDEAFVVEANKALARLQPYKIGHKGNLQEWFYDWEDEDPHHRHQSHLFGIYPGHHLVDGVNTKEAIHHAASRTLELKGDRTTGWSTGWRVNLYARLHDAKKAYHIYRKLLSYVSPDGYRGADARRGGGTYPNLLDAHSPFQIDGNFGGCAGVIEMLMQSEYSLMPTKAAKYDWQPYVLLELLPALPSNWKDGAVSGIRARGGITVDMKWQDSRVTSLTLTALHSCKVIVMMNGHQQKVKLKKGRNKVLLID
ncbi:glycoside hydrolase N-terminal domain-containing protein [Prevotella sp. E2-28]|uniref:glycoside hydrolase family 95 protein n=1 Tax=Prevotella sp. E2-28 TaxID=2913620 RepID=UPI001EDACB25|nr:glycoside hydrolase family 95 protein [Prevotella sp. E2-28]UKK53027.1 glycoside hydrolase family 95 protein [Prevotella sp. E2-28]